MDQLDFVTLNVNEDKIDPILVTPGPRTANADIPSPKAPTKKPVIGAAPALAVEDVTADFTIICNGGNIKAHKSVLVEACPYFARMFRFDGKVKRVHWFCLGLETDRDT
jgi:hypothetical protein